MLGGSAHGTGVMWAALAAGGHTRHQTIPLRAPVPGGFTSDDVIKSAPANTHLVLFT